MRPVPNPTARPAVIDRILGEIDARKTARDLSITPPTLPTIWHREYSQRHWPDHPGARRPSGGRNWQPPGKIGFGFVLKSCPPITKIRPRCVTALK
jgi:hypothetical protein